MRRDNLSQPALPQGLRQSRLPPRSRLYLFFGADGLKHRSAFNMIFYYQNNMKNTYTKMALLAISGLILIVGIKNY